MPKIFPSFQERRVGEYAQLGCTSTTAISWTFENSILPANVEIGKRHEYIMIFNVELKNSGTYKCITKDEGGREHTLEGLIFVIKGKISK